MTDAEMTILPKGHPAVTPSGQDGRADGGSGRGRGMRTCDVEGCTEKHVARGMCRTHYAQWHRLMYNEKHPEYAEHHRKLARECYHRNKFRKPRGDVA
jgi:hypothetical protein